MSITRKEQFVNLKVNKKTLGIIEKEFSTRLNNNDESAIFFNEVIGTLKEHFYLKYSCKIKREKTMLDIYNLYSEIKEMGCRKELVLPF